MNEPQKSNSNHDKENNPQAPLYTFSANKIWYNQISLVYSSCNTVNLSNSMNDIVKKTMIDDFYGVSYTFRHTFKSKVYSHLPMEISTTDSLLNMSIQHWKVIQRYVMYAV